MFNILFSLNITLEVNVSTIPILQTKNGSKSSGTYLAHSVSEDAGTPTQDHLTWEF